MKVPCPICKKEVEYEGNEFRPFCSERCQTLDLGAWADQKHAIPLEHESSSQKDSEQDEE